MPPRDLTGVLADQLPPGPALAACLSGADPAALSEWDLPGVASAFRRLAGWAQAGELAAVAEMASRTAARDDHVRVDADGRPDQVTPAAGSTVGLELVMSHPAAMAWTGLGVTLRWRLAATLAALSAGTIDLYRARLIAEATSPLDDDTARAVESAVLPKAGRADQRAAARRAAPRGDRRGPGGRGAAPPGRGAAREGELVPGPGGHGDAGGDAAAGSPRGGGDGPADRDRAGDEVGGDGRRPGLPALGRADRPAAGHPAPGPPARR